MARGRWWALLVMFMCVFLHWAGFCGSRAGQEHRVHAEEPSVEWVPREQGEAVKVYYERVLAAAGDRALARRLGGGSCFG
eukprot:14606064-Alexandrium_andersonii.AAC.1